MASIVILGAGLSRRMGENKLLLELGESTIIENTVLACANSMADDIVLVYSDEEVYDKVSVHSDKIRLIKNENPERGQSTSVILGMENISKEATGVLLVLGDMPFLTTKVIDDMIIKFNSLEKFEDTIIVPTYEGERGNPRLFGKNYFEEILNTEGDKGPRELIKKYKDDVLEFECGSISVLEDIDTPSDYDKYINQP